MQTPVMMVHGMCCTGDVWSTFRSLFEERGTRVFTPTLAPEHRVGVRQRPQGGLRTVGFGDYVQQLESEARKIEAETGTRPAVIGHSMGGLLAQVLAERGCVSAAVFISPSAPADVRDIPTRLVWAGVTAAYRLGLGPWAIRPGGRTLSRSVFNMVPQSEHRSTREAMVHESGRAFLDLANWPVDESKIRVPVLTVAATRDRLVPARLVRLTAKKYATIGGDFVEYAQHGHWMYGEPGWEQPAAEIYDWLTRVLARPAA